jgi:hypothetical protein
MKETLWEEKNLIGTMKNSENNLVFEQKDFTKKTKIELEKKECKDIGKEKKWIRKCPKCGKDIVYTVKSTMVTADINNSCCRNCGHTKHERKPFYTKTCDCGKKQIYTNRKVYERSLKKNTRCRVCSGKENGKYTLGRKRTDEFKRYMRVTSIKRLKARIKNFSSRSNPVATKFIEEYGNQNGFNFQHALNGGEYHIEELGYFVDGYDKEKNVVFEYDEPNHYYRNGHLKNKDIKRMSEIMNHLHCRFIRYNEQMNKTEEFPCNIEKQG